MESNLGTFVRFIVLVLAVSYALPIFVHLSLPYPYDHFEVSSLPVEFTKYSAFNARTISPAEYAVEQRARLYELTNMTTVELFHGQVKGAESVAVTGQQLVMFDKFGVVHTAVLDQQTQSYSLSNTTLYTGPGRSLGFDMLSAEEAIVCDSVKGLLAVKLGGLTDGATAGDRIRVLSNAVSSLTWHPSNVINYANDLDIARQDGHDIVYFSSSTTNGVVAFDSAERYYDTMRSFVLTMLAADVSGRLLMYNMTSKSTQVILKDLYYANGVAVAADHSYVLVVETVGLRVWKHHLAGPQRGSSEVFIDQLPGFPDGITRSQDGNSYYISIVAPLSPLFSTGSLIMQSPAARWAASWVLVNLSPWLATLGILKKLGCVMKVSAESAEVQSMLLDSSGDTVSTISAVTESDENLFFGNLGGESVFSWKKSQWVDEVE